MEPQVPSGPELHWRSPNKITLLLTLLIVALGLGWIVLSKYAVPPLIQSAHRGESLSIFNQMIAGRASHPVEEYLLDWERLQWRVLLGLLMGGVFLVLVTRPEFQRALSAPPSRETFFVPGEQKTLSSQWREHLVSFVGYLALAVIFTLPTSIHPTRALLGDGGDSYQHAWFLWEFGNAVARGHDPFHTHLVFYPFGGNLAWATLDPLAGILALPLTLAFGPLLAYNLSLILQLALSAFFARLLCLRVSGDSAAATVGGVIFGFSPYMLAHALGHLSLVTAFPIPLYVLALVNLLETEKPSWRDGALLGLALLMTSFAHFQYTVFCLTFTAVVLAIDFGRERAALLERLWRPLLVSATTFLICFFPILRMLLQDGLRHPHPVTEAEHYSADLLGFFVPSPFNPFFGRFVHRMPAEFLATGFEGVTYIGFIVLALATVGFYWAHNRRRWAVPALIAGVLFGALCLGPTVHVLGKPTRIPAPASLLYSVEFARFLREPGRMSVITTLSVALLATFGLAFMSNKLARRWQKALLFCIVGLGLLVEYSTVPFPSSSIVDPDDPYTDTPTTAQRCSLPPHVRDKTVLTVPLFQWGSWKEAVWMQAMDGGRYDLVEGYLGPYVPGEVWSEFDRMPIVGSLSRMPTESVMPEEDRKFADFIVRKLNLGAVVIFDASERPLEIDYVRKKPSLVIALYSTLHLQTRSNF